MGRRGAYMLWSEVHEIEYAAEMMGQFFVRIKKVSYRNSYSCNVRRVKVVDKDIFKAKPQISCHVFYHIYHILYLLYHIYLQWKWLFLHSAQH